MVRMRPPVVMIYQGVHDILKANEAPHMIRRPKRQYISDEDINLNTLGQPVGIPDEFKAQDEIISLWQD